MICDCGDKISEKALSKSINFRMDKIVCDECFQMWAETKGIKFGRPRKELQIEKIQNPSGMSVSSLAKQLGCGRNTIYRRFKIDEDFKKLLQGKIKPKVSETYKRRRKLSKLFIEKLDKLSDLQMQQIWNFLRKIQ